MIEVTDLEKHYGAVPALRGVSFGVERGEVVGLLGPNGAGKSTAMRIITGYLAPTSGSARVAGAEVMDDPVAAQRHIGYLPEGNPLYLELRLREALRFAAGMHGLRGADRDRAIARAVEAAGLRGLEHRKIVTFSRGYRQRVGLAQALLHEPPALILDEPSSGLDPNQQVDMRKFIRSLGQSCAVIFSTHILPEVTAVCDRILVINKGCLVGEGTTDEIVARSGLPGRVEVVVDGSPDAARKALGDVAFLSNVATENEGEGLTHLRADVAGAVDDDALRAVAGALRSSGVDFVGLEVDPVGLDEVFAALTREDPVPAPAPEPVAAAAPAPSGDDEEAVQ